MTYNYHKQYVRNFCTQHPSHKLIEVDITDKDSGKILAESFGLKEEGCWGHFNMNRDGDNNFATSDNTTNLTALQIRKENSQKFSQQQQQPRVSSSANGNDIEISSGGISNKKHDAGEDDSNYRSRKDQNEKKEFYKQKRKERLSKLANRIANDQTEINIKESLLLAAG